MSITPAELAQLAINAKLCITVNGGDLDCPTGILSCISCLLYNHDSVSCRFWSRTPDHIHLDTRRKAITYIHSHHPEFFL